MGGMSASLVAAMLATLTASVLAAGKAPAPSTLTSQAQQLAALGQKSAGQVAGTATHISQEAAQEGQRQVGNLRTAADIAAAPIATGLSNEGAALLEAAKVLGLPRLEEVLSPRPTTVPDGPADDFDPNADSLGDESPSSSSSDDASPASAPAPSQFSRNKKKKDAAQHPAPVPDSSDSAAMSSSGGPAAAPRASKRKAQYVPDPHFKGKPLERTPADIKSFRQFQKAAKKHEESVADNKTIIPPFDRPVPFPVVYLDQLYNLNDKELYKIFHRGTAEIPSEISAKKFAFCDRPLTLTNSIERPSGWPSIPWPEADELFATPQRFVWEGKFFVTYPNKETKLFNLIFFDNNLDVIANVTKLPGGYSADCRDSFEVNYGASDITPGRIARDEFRRVGPTIFLGRGFGWLDLKDLYPKYATGLEKACLDAIAPLRNATVETILQAQKVVRRLRNTNNLTDISYPPLRALPFSFYFAVDCQDYRIPSVHYTPILADAFTNFNIIAGYEAPYYRLPTPPLPYTDPTWDQSQGKFTAPPFQGYPAADTKNGTSQETDEALREGDYAKSADLNDPSADIKFGSKAKKGDEPYVLFPINVPGGKLPGSDENTQGFVKVPARRLETAFGPFWDQKAPATASGPKAAKEGDMSESEAPSRAQDAFTG